MLHLIKRSIRPLPTKHGKYRGVIQCVWDGPQVNTNKLRSSSPSGVQEINVSLTRFVSFTASQFYFSGKTFQYPRAATKRRAFGTFFRRRSFGGNVALSRNANTQADMTHGASTSSSITHLSFHSVKHGCNYRSSATHAEGTCVSICTPAHLRQESGGGSGSSVWRAEKQLRLNLTLRCVFVRMEVSEHNLWRTATSPWAESGTNHCEANEGVDL